MLAGRAAAGPLELVLFDGVVGVDWSWSQRDEAMAGRILAASPPGARTLVVAGNADTPASPIELGVPMGARLAGQRPGIGEVQIRYGGGNSCDGEPRQFPRYTGPEGLIRLHQDDGELFLDLPAAAEAVVPQRPRTWSGLFWSERPSHQPW